VEQLRDEILVVLVDVQQADYPPESFRLNPRTCLATQDGVGRLENLLERLEAEECSLTTTSVHTGPADISEEPTNEASDGRAAANLPAGETRGSVCGVATIPEIVGLCKSRGSICEGATIPADVPGCGDAGVATGRGATAATAAGSISISGSKSSSSSALSSTSVSSALRPPMSESLDPS